jgi:protein-S-isoprenylcysteine O-methyltransferase Ste14
VANPAGQAGPFSRRDEAIAWTGGAVFVTSLALAAWWYAVELGRPRQPAGAAPLVVDIVLFTMFALHHSVFARSGVKAVMLRIVPDHLLRPLYVWTASLLLALVCLGWQPIGGAVYRLTGWAAAIGAVGQLVGILLIAQSVRAIDPLELAGIKLPKEVALQVDGPYGLVRHPLYLGWILALFGAPTMTSDRLVFASISSLYLVVAIPWEERALVGAFGEAYRRYQQNVRWRLVPYVF